MRVVLFLISALMIAQSGCLTIPAFPKVLPLERCSQVPRERLFNKEISSPEANKAELRIIRDVGYGGESDEVTVIIDSVKFADFRIWEASSAFLRPGKHTIKLIHQNGTFLAGKEPTNLLELDLPSGSPSTIRIDLGRSNPPLRQTIQ